MSCGCNLPGQLQPPAALNSRLACFLFACSLWPAQRRHCPFGSRWRETCLRWEAMRQPLPQQLQQRWRLRPKRTSEYAAEVLCTCRALASARWLNTHSVPQRDAAQAATSLKMNLPGDLMFILHMLCNMSYLTLLCNMPPFYALHPARFCSFDLFSNPSWHSAMLLTPPAFPVGDAQRLPMTPSQLHQLFSLSVSVQMKIVSSDRRRPCAAPAVAAGASGFKQQPTSEPTF